MLKSVASVRAALTVARSVGAPSLRAYSTYGRKSYVPIIKLDNSTFLEYTEDADHPTVIHAFNKSRPVDTITRAVNSTARETFGRMNLAHLNTAAQPETAARLGVEGAANTVLLMHKGDCLLRVEEPSDVADLKRRLQKTAYLVNV